MEISEQLAKFVNSNVEEGRYENAREVVREALLRNFQAVARPVKGAMDEDIPALAYLVMMEATKSAQEDLKMIMNEVRAINAAKARLRVLLGQLYRDRARNADGRQPLDLSTGLGSEENYHRVQMPVPDPQAIGRWVAFVVTDLCPGPISKADLDATVDRMKNDLDSLSEMGEMESLRLQTAMDRLSKMMSTLSNLLKKISDTASSITQNLK